MVDSMGRPILARKLHHAGALFLSLLGFEGRTVHTAAIQLLRNARAMIFLLTRHLNECF